VAQGAAAVWQRVALRQLRGGAAKAVFGGRPGQGRLELAFEVGQFNPVLRPFGSGHAGRHRGQVQFQLLRVGDLALLRHAKQALRAVVVLVRAAVFFAAARRPQVVDALGVNGEEAHRRPVFRGHVGDGCPVHHRQRRGARPEELDKLPHHPRLPQPLGHRQRQVRRGDALAQFAEQVHADDIRREQIDRLAQHAGFRLDAAHAPAHDAQPVNHRGVGIRADQRVGVEQGRRGRAAGEGRRRDPLGEVFQVYLVDDADAGRHHFEFLKRLHAPLEELVALAVALELQRHIPFEGVRRAVVIHLHRMIHDEVHRHQRLDEARVPAQPRQGRAHGRQVHQQRHPREVLQHNARDHERNLLAARRVGLPVGQRPHVRLGHPPPVAIPQYRLQHQPEGHRQPGNRANAGPFQLRQRIQRSRPAIPRVKCLQRAKPIMRVAHKVHPASIKPAADKSQRRLAPRASSRRAAGRARGRGGPARAAGVRLTSSGQQINNGPRYGCAGDGEANSKSGAGEGGGGRTPRPRHAVAQRRCGRPGVAAVWF